MAEVVSKKSDVIEAEIIAPDFSNFTVGGKPAEVQSWNINLTNTTGGDSLAVSFVGLPYYGKYNIVAGQPIKMKVGDKEINAAIKSIKSSLMPDGKITTTVDVIDVTYYLDTFLFQTFKTEAQDIAELISGIYNEIGIPISVDRDNIQIKWFLEKFKMFKIQNVLDYINSAIQQSDVRLVNWWIDIFGVLHLFKPLSPKPAAIKFDFPTYANSRLILDFDIEYNDPDKYRASLDNIDINNPSKASETRTVREYTIDAQTPGVVKTKLGNTRETKYDRNGILMAGNNVKEIQKITSMATITLIGTHYFLPHSAFKITNSPFGELDDFIVSSVSINHNSAADITTTISLESGKVGYF